MASKADGQRPSLYTKDIIAGGATGQAHVIVDEISEPTRSITFSFFQTGGGGISSAFEVCFESAADIRDAIKAGQAAVDALPWKQWDFSLGAVGTTNISGEQIFTMVGFPVAYRARSVSGDLTFTAVGQKA